MIKSIKYIAIIALATILFSCEKDEVKVVMLDNPIPPSLVSMPNLNLQQSNAANVLEFVGTPVDLGFQPSVKYYLEACLTGTDYAKPISVMSDIQDTLLKISVGDLNTALLKKIKNTKQATLDFRIKALITVDAGTGQLGSSSNPMVYVSANKTVDVTMY